ncbi:MAG: hypothetical protein NPIRA05_03790 [Nitrospirales bacterium]|nr:MAG: hypothetical protein NPIRA05_03790 [Nitrospirales bacterium]
MRQYRWALQKVNRPLGEAHVGLGIKDKEFDIAAAHSDVTSKEFNVSQKEYDELMPKSAGFGTMWSKPV